MTSLAARQTKSKLPNLRESLEQMDRVLIAFSGGVDSTFLLKIAEDTLGAKVLAVTARSPAYPEEEYVQACRLARRMGVEHLTIESRELENDHFVENPPQRCYYCKRELFGDLLAIARERGIPFVSDATNLDDCSDYRPGRRAARELGVRSPLQEVGMTKQEIRDLSKALGLPTWDKPAMACLASRFPYGETITRDGLRRVAGAERRLREFGFEHVRVRSHANIARIEVLAGQIEALARADGRQEIVDALKALGFSYVAVDLQGYRTGSLNEELAS